MEHTEETFKVTNEENLEATKENPLNLEDDKEDDKDVRKRKKRTSQAWEHFDEMPLLMT
ncbi:hypothetical protein DCAR_0311661 [Daucus carota subsp. sativus]|uniref:Uncharacterized protein n=1 Tax=Daucus carota subsp. sativus TaxID=79200 RepID=A0A162AIP5_DAUCS|nr:hypothetical protein DCAR_0311661 [Daucus carota subsp. sativus]